MKLPPTPRVRFLRDLMGDVAGERGGRLIVAVDGAHGTRSFSDDLAVVVREAGRTAFRASISDFHRSRADRAPFGAETPESYYERAYDYVTLRRVLVDPFRMAGSAGFQTAAFDEQRDLPWESRWQTGPSDAVLVIDGEFLLRPELRSIWDFSVVLTNVESDPVYDADAQPYEHADVLVDDADPVHPRRMVVGQT